MTKVLKKNNESSKREISEIPKMFRKVPKRILLKYKIKGGSLR